MILAETFVELIKDPNHWLFEGATDIVYTALGAIGMRAWVKAHDRNHHHHECKDEKENNGVN